MLWCTCTYGRYNFQLLYDTRLCEIFIFPTDIGRTIFGTKGGGGGGARDDKVSAAACSRFPGADNDLQTTRSPVYNIIYTYIPATVPDNGTSGSRHTDNRLNCPLARARR